MEKVCTTELQHSHRYRGSPGASAPAIPCSYLGARQGRGQNGLCPKPQPLLHHQGRGIHAGISHLAPGDEICQLVKGLAWLLWDILKIILHLCHTVFIHSHAGKWLENPCLGWEHRPEEAL